MGVNNWYPQDIVPDGLEKCAIVKITIHFHDDNRVDNTGLYIQRWTQIVIDYQNRVADYPILKQNIDYNFLLAGITNSDKLLFRRYVDELNRLLDADFSCVKNIYFAGIRRLGIGIYGVSNDSVEYWLYKIGYHDNLPDVILTDKNPSELSHHSEDMVAAHLSAYHHIQEPELEAQTFVFGYLKQAIVTKRLRNYGKFMSEDIVQSFVNKYRDLLGIPEKPIYSVSEISDRFYGYLPRAISATMLSFYNHSDISHHFDIDEILSQDIDPAIPYTQHGVDDESETPVAIVSSQFPLHALQQSLEYLRSLSVSHIQNEMPIRNGHSVDSEIWRSHDAKTQAGIAEKILRRAARAYESFVNANRLLLPNSSYLDNTTTVLWIFSPSSGLEGSHEPLLSEFHLANKEGSTAVELGV